MFTTALNFNGTAAQAIEFYSTVFEYEVKDEDVWKGEVI